MKLTNYFSEWLGWVAKPAPTTPADPPLVPDLQVVGTGGVTRDQNRLIHLPNRPAVEYLRKSFNPNTAPVSAEELREMEIARVANDIKDQLEGKEHVSINGEDRGYLEAALTQVFNGANDDNTKTKVLNLLSQENSLFSESFLCEMHHQHNFFSNFVINMDLNELIDNLLNSDKPNRYIEYIVSSLIKRSDAKELIESLFTEDTEISTLILSEAFAQWDRTASTKSIDLFSLEQCFDLYKRRVSLGELNNHVLEKIRRIFMQTTNLKLLERILTEEETDLTLVAAKRYAELSSPQEAVGKLSERLLNIKEPSNIVGLCSVLFNSGEQGQNAILEAARSQSQNEGLDKSILLGLCKAKKPFVVDDFRLSPALSPRITVNPEFTQIMRLLFSQHGSIMKDLENLHKVNHENEFNVYEALLEKIDPNIMIKWLAEEVEAKSSDISDSTFAANILEFLSKFGWQFEGAKVASPDTWKIPEIDPISLRILQDILGIHLDAEGYAM